MSGDAIRVVLHPSVGGKSSPAVARSRSARRGRFGLSLPSCRRLEERCAARLLCNRGASPKHLSHLGSSPWCSGFAYVAACVA